MDTQLSTKPILTLPANTQGTDYVVGDLHGCFQLLQDALDKVFFDPACDRLFSVGDLVDRGPDSLKCLQLLAEPWFHAVMGNHEAMLANFFADYDLLNSLPNDELDCWFNTEKLGDLDSHSVSQKLIFLNNGGSWVSDYYDLERQRMTAAFDQAVARVFCLPQMIVVGTGDARFQIVHSELLSNNIDFAPPNTWLDEDIDRWAKGEAIPEQTLSRMLWGRTLFGMRNPRNHTPLQAGLSLTYCGHTIDTTVRQALSHVCLDTGAFMTYPPYQDTTGEFGLTLYDAHLQQAVPRF